MSFLCLKFTKGSGLTWSKIPNYSGPWNLCGLISYIPFPLQAATLDKHSDTVPLTLQAHTYPQVIFVLFSAVLL